MTRSLRSTYPRNVLFILPPCLPTPPHGYGGIEAVAAALLPAMEAAGVRLSVCTPIGSTVQVYRRYELSEPIFPILSHPYNEVAPSIEAYIAKISNIIATGNFDVIHDFSGMLTILNTLALPLRLTNDYPPVIHTIHGPITPFLDTYTELLEAKRLTYTGISNAQIDEIPARMKARTKVINNGLDINDYPSGPGGKRLLVLGRLCHDKGQDRLIEYAAKAGLALDVAGTVAELRTKAEIEAEAAKGADSLIAQKKDFQFYQRIKHHFDDSRIVFHGNVAGQHKTDLLGGASALVVPNRWSEPFGMVAIEAMATGTPVIAMGTGAMPELIKHGVTGYLARNWNELCGYLNPEAIGRLDRAAARQHVIDNFSVERIAAEYIKLYGEVMQASPTRQQRTKLITRSPQLAPMYERLSGQKDQLVR